MKHLIFISALIFPLLAFGQLGCPTRSFGEYEPEKPLSIYDLPDSIRTKLESHLIDRLGQMFYSKLLFNGGQIVDLEKLYSENPGAKNYQWTPYSYYLCFSIVNTEQLFTAQIVLDKFGNVQKEIDLPNVKKDTLKESIISLELAKKIAEKQKCYDTNTSVRLKYDEENDLMVWQFRGANYTSKRNDRSSSSSITLSAHDGSVLDKKRHRNIKKSNVSIWL